MSTFIDQTGRAQLVVDPIADMLTTELFMVKRFELYDRQDLVEQTHAKSFGQNQEAKVTGGHADKTSLQYRNVSETGKVDGSARVCHFIQDERGATRGSGPPA